MKKKSRPKPTHEEIVRCASLIYESRSREQGRDLEDWLKAKTQLIADRNQEVEADKHVISNERTVPWENVQPAEIITTSFEVTMAGKTYTFDSFECAIQSLAPVCPHCHCKIIGHGVEEKGVVYCCAHCAQESGARQVKDRA